jgi:hypothetical protein
VTATTKGSAKGSTLTAASNAQTGASISAFVKKKFRNLPIAAKNDALTRRGYA